VPLGFCNAVLEHLPSARQRAAVREFARVARRGVIFTPSRYCLVEPHFWVPFFQFVPSWLQRATLSVVGLGIYGRGEWEEVSLVSPGWAMRLCSELGCRCVLVDGFLPGDQIAIMIHLEHEVDEAFAKKEEGE
jgi:hypothetical protein